MPKQDFLGESADGTMVDRAVNGRAGRCGWRVAATAAVMLSPLAQPAVGQQQSPPTQDMMQLSVEPVHQRVVDTAWRAKEQIADAYERSPVLVIGLGLAGTLPLLAGLFAVARVIRRRDTGHVPPAAPMPDDDIPPGGKAWIDLGGDAAPVMFTGELLRIGRHSDNDITLEHDSVHRHHALIQRTPDEEFILIDLTAGRGNKLLRNGTPVGRALLKNGDRITFGDVTLTFNLGTGAPVRDLEPPNASRPSFSSAREMTHDDGDAADRTTGGPADRIETRRIKPSDGLPPRSADRGGA